MSSRGASGATVSGRSRKAAVIEAMPTGMLTRKIIRQSVPKRFSEMSAPPTSGPRIVAMPMVAPNSPNARPRSRGGMVTWIVESTCGTMSPAPAPCTIRKRMSSVGLPDTPQPREPSVNTAIPRMNKRFRP